MIQATGGGADGTPFLLLGLSAENCRRLVAGMPIAVRADLVDPRLPKVRVILVGGETEDDIAAELRQNMPGA
jgi:hypothetical protein